MNDNPELLKDNEDIVIEEQWFEQDPFSEEESVENSLSIETDELFEDDPFIDTAFNGVGYNPNRDPKTGQFTFGSGGKSLSNLNVDSLPVIEPNSDRLWELKDKIKEDTAYLTQEVDSLDSDWVENNRKREVVDGVPAITTNLINMRTAETKAVTAKIKHVYRAVSHDELKFIKKTGVIKSDGSMNMSNENERSLTVYKETDPTWYLPKEGGHVLKIEVKPENGFHFFVDSYPKTAQAVPASQILEIDEIVLSKPTRNAFNARGYNPYRDESTGRFTFGSSSSSSSMGAIKAELAERAKKRMYDGGVDDFISNEATHYRGETAARELPKTGGDMGVGYYFTDNAFIAEKYSRGSDIVKRFVVDESNVLKMDDSISSNREITQEWFKRYEADIPKRYDGAPMTYDEFARRSDSVGNFFNWVYIEANPGKVNELDDTRNSFLKDSGFSGIEYDQSSVLTVDLGGDYDAKNLLMFSKDNVLDERQLTKIYNDARSEAKNELAENGRGYNPNRDDKTGQFTFGPGGSEKGVDGKTIAALKQEALNHDNVDEFIETVSYTRPVLFHGGDPDGIVGDNSFFGDFYNHAKEYAAGYEDDAGVVTGILYDPDDVVYFDNNENTRMLREKYVDMPDSKLKKIYGTQIEDGTFFTAMDSFNISEEQVLPLVKQYLAGEDIEISNDFLIPLYQDFAKKDGKNIVSFEGYDFGGSTEYVVAKIDKQLNLNELYKKARSEAANSLGYRVDNRGYNPNRDPETGRFTWGDGTTRADGAFYDKAQSYSDADSFVEANIIDYATSKPEYDKWAKDAGVIEQVYHGTPNEFDKFEDPENNPNQTSMYPSNGIFFSDDKSLASQFAAGTPQEVSDKRRQLLRDHQESIEATYRSVEISDSDLAIARKFAPRLTNTDSKGLIVIADMFSGDSEFKAIAKKYADKLEPKLSAEYERYEAADAELASMSSPKTYTVRIKGDRIVNVDDVVGFGSGRDSYLNENPDSIIHFNNADTGAYIGREIAIRNPENAYILNTSKNEAELRRIYETSHDPVVNALIDAVYNRGYNPNRDPKSGRFTWGKGGKSKSSEYTKFWSTQQAYDYIEAQESKISINEEEAGVVSDYQNFEFDTINEVARTGTTDVSFYDANAQGEILQRFKDKVKTLETVIKKNKVPENIKAWRIVSSNHIEDPTDPRIYKDDGFMSTSISREFIQANESNWQGRAHSHVVEIDVPAGTPGLYVNAITKVKRGKYGDSFGDEAELLFGPETDLEYISHETENGINYVKARIKA